MFGICQLSIIPVRSEPSERSEMVTQLLFGEIYEIMDTQDNWLLVKCIHDQYEGWIDNKLSQELISHPEETLTRLINLVHENIANAVSNTTNLPVLLVKGSLLPEIKNNSFQLNEISYSLSGETVELPTQENLSKLGREALSYLNTPYLWGGRTPLGIDCSGFVQMVFRFCGIQLPRDAHQQATKGESLNFLYETIPGDLAFFDNAAGSITHVGLILGEGQIIHAYGTVRIDALDHNGIFNRATGKYTHNLRIIKRIVPAA